MINLMPIFTCSMQNDWFWLFLIYMFNTGNISVLNHDGYHTSNVQTLLNSYASERLIFSHIESESKKKSFLMLH